MTDPGQDTENQHRNIIQKYIHVNAVDSVIQFLISNKIILEIKKARVSKNGDFRPFPNGICKITINQNLGKDRFLITLLHEFAHFKAWEKNHNLRSPHGNIWKFRFYELIKEYVGKNCFHENTSMVLLKSFTINSNNIIFHKKFLHSYLLTELENNRNILKNCNPKPKMIFTLKNGHVFEIIEKRRTRYLCRNCKNGKQYLVHELVEIAQ